MKTSDSIAKISSALVKAQKKMGAATKDATNPFFKSKYADLSSIMEVVKAPLNEEGLAILQPTYSEHKENGVFHYVETILIHESAEWLSSGQLKLELTKVDMQQVLAATTYARRVQLQSLLAIPMQDDDGESTSLRPAAVVPVAAASPGGFKQFKATNGVF